MTALMRATHPRGSGVDPGVHPRSCETTPPRCGGSSGGFREAIDRAQRRSEGRREGRPERGGVGRKEAGSPREVRPRCGENADLKDARDCPTRGLIAGPEGTFIVGSPWLGRVIERRIAGGAETAGSLRARGPGRRCDGEGSAMPIEHVRVGRRDGEVRVHATLSEGAHRGVELRAVARNGRVEVELVADNADALARLQRELPSLRAALGDGARADLSVCVVGPEEGRAGGGDRGLAGDRGGDRREGHDEGTGDEPSARRGASVAVRGRARGRDGDADEPWEVL
jgi:hypothetical protein